MRKTAFASAFVARLLCLAIAFTFSFVLATTGCGGGGSLGSGGGGGSQKTNPVITWAAPTAITYGTALSSTQLDATASVAGTFVYTPALGAVPTAGTQTLSVSFTPTDTADYNSTSSSVQLVVNKAESTVTWPIPAAIIAGTALSSTQLDATASVAGTFVYAPASGTIMPTAGTQTLLVTFTPTDTTDYTTVTANVTLTVNPSVPTITGGTLYAVSDGSSLSVPETLTCAGCAAGDILHDATGIFADLTLPSAETTLSFYNAWEQGDYEPIFDTNEIKHAGGAYGNSWSIAFLGSASQSTAAVSPTGTVYQIEQKTGQVYTLPLGGTTKPLFSGISGSAPTPVIIAIDDVSNDLVYASTNGSGGIGVTDKNGTPLCYFIPTGITSISSVAAKGGYITFTAPNENKVGFASLGGCSKNVGIPFTTIAISGQPWSVAMSENGSEIVANVFSRDLCVKGQTCLTQINVATGVQEGQVATSIPPVSTIRLPGTPGMYEGVYSVQAFNQTPIAAVLFMSNSADGEVLIINTDTSNGKIMAVTHTTPVPELPIAIAAQETVTSAAVRVAYLDGTGNNVVLLGTIDPTTGNYTPSVGACQAGLISITADANGVHCTGGSVIAPPIVLQP